MPKKFYRNDLHRIMAQPESYWNGHTPNWPKDETHCNCVNITVSIRFDGNGGLTQPQAEDICKRIEKLIKGRSQIRIVSAQV